MSSATTASVIDAAREFVAAESDALRHAGDAVDEVFVRVASLLLSSPGKVVLTGAGTSGFIARRAAHLMSVSGTPAFFLNPTDALHGSMAAIQAQDVMIALSKGGNSEEVNELARRMRADGIVVVALTSTAGSELAMVSDIAVTLDGVSAADPGGVIAMGSTLAYSAWLDALAVVLMRARGYGWDKVLFSHPGGAVGTVTQLPAPLEGLSIPGLAELGRS